MTYSNHAQVEPARTGETDIQEGQGQLKMMSMEEVDYFQELTTVNRRGHLDERTSEVAVCLEQVILERRIPMVS